VGLNKMTIEKDFSVLGNEFDDDLVINTEFQDDDEAEKIWQKEQKRRKKMIELLIDCQATCEEYRTGKKACNNCDANPTRD